MSDRRPRLAFAMTPDALRRIFPPDRIARVEELAEVTGYLTEFDSAQARSILADVEVLITGWLSPRVDAEVLHSAPQLRAVLHSGGSTKSCVSEDVFAQGIAVTSTAEVNAVPVAEFTAAMVLLATKRVLPIAARYRMLRSDFDVESAFPAVGAFEKRVGIVGASRIGRGVIKRLREYDLEVVVYDPYLTDVEADELDVRSVGLDELLSTSDVVSVHAPSLSSTRNLIDARGIGLMRRGATLVNTARGEIVDQDALTARVLAGELFAILDVTTPWVLPADNPLYDHDHVLLTPHIAGSVGTELGRLSDVVIEELARFASGEPLMHQVDIDRLAITA